MHLPSTFLFAIWFKWLEPIDMKHAGDFSFNTSIKQSICAGSIKIILRMWSDMLLAGVWLYNSMYLTHFLLKR